MELTMESLRQWKPSPDQIKAAETVFIAKAMVETIRPIVRGYQQAILDYEKYSYADKHFGGRRGVTPQDWISDPDLTYLMDDNEFKHYLKRCNEERIKAGLHVESEEYCPLLVAENKLTQAEHVLIEAMEPVTGISFDKIMCSGHALEHLKEYNDLLLKIMAHHVRQSDAIMKDFRVLSTTSKHGGCHEYR